MSYWLWFYTKKCFRENKEFGSRSDRRLTQVGTELKGFVFRMGYAASFARFLMRGSRNFRQLGAQLTQKSYFYTIISSTTYFAEGPNGLFKEIYKLICFYAVEGGVQNFQRVQLLIPMVTYKTWDFPWEGGPDSLSLSQYVHASS